MHFTTLELIENINRNIKEDYGLKVPENENSNLGIGEKLYTKTFGSYVVSNNWIESEEHSTNSKFFYVASGEEREERPNNISVNAGTNKYSSSEHEKFKDADSLVAVDGTGILQLRDVEQHAKRSRYRRRWRRGRGCRRRCFGW